MDTSEYVRSGERTLAGISFEIMNSEAFDSLDLNSSNIQLLSFAIYSYHAFHYYRPELAKEICDGIAKCIVNSHGEHNSNERRDALQKTYPILANGVADAYENNQTMSTPPHIALGFDICDIIGNGYNPSNCHVVELGLIVKRFLDIGYEQFKKYWKE
ncbi:hypothetical protein CW753_25720 [Klebsiella pneumoniae]|uniref:hypothetical protein n=1 Tax=Enterobacteriaceae TaxID=543 RepID=UPI000D21A463|nr:hypothetical protein [Klebsiella pneumoniae]AVI92658.1 hypothetical protein CW753_25720 [Klebsiella pneumoniae]MDR4713755.1 hypothetical protein [Klebsiella pneumoniae]HBY0439965.1 hypothetical protein [Klebsiella pneumoniae subsp. pneumoniae]HCI7893079.1 hypothetical protein [Klebsiella pneumoniae]